MMLTEEAMKTKWCPEYRLPLNPTSSQATGGNTRQVGDANCIGSACAMWRWGPAQKCADCKGTGLEVRGGYEYPCKPCQGTGISGPPATGYCGLAGRP